MIRRLRRRHRRWTTALAVVLPVLFALAIGARTPDPLSASARGVDAPSGEAGWREAGGVLLRRGEDRDGPWVEVAAVAPDRPDLLVYWVPPGGGAEDGWLLGPAPASGRRLYRPPAAAPAAGEWLLYSGAHRAVVTRERPQRGEGTGGGR